MKIQTVSYQKVFPIAMYVNERIGLEATIDDSESPEAALLILKKIVTEFHEKNNPHLYNDSIPTPEPITLPVKQVEKAVAGDSKEDLELQEITKHIDGIEFQEDAIEYLNTTDFKLYVPLKILISSKPTKTK